MNQFTPENFPENAAEAAADDLHSSAASPPAESPLPDHLIEVHDLDVAFDSQYVLKDIDVSIEKGETLAVIGESGCGKTVFLKTLVRLIDPNRGTVRFAGQDLSKLSSEALSNVRRRFGFVFQSAALFDSMSIFDNVAFPMRQSNNVDEKEIRERVLKHIREVGLPATVITKRPSELSGGMRKRVGIARAIILQPELVVYDEPTTGLDPIMSDVVNELMLDVRQRYPVTSVIVTHDMRTARKVADRVLMFYPRSRLNGSESQVLYDGPPDGLDDHDDARIRQFVRGEAGERLTELTG
jgi:phospholipid/cholesterol/gamma-HCH transport system ATP-binding protein